MRNRNTRKKGSALNVLIAVFAVILAIAIVITISVFRENTRIYTDREDTLYMYLSSGEYQSLAQRYYDSGLSRDSIKDGLMEYYAVGLYYEEMFYAHAYEAAGETEKAAGRYARAERWRSLMGGFADEAAKIDKLFE